MPRTQKSLTFLGAALRLALPHSRARARPYNWTPLPRERERDQRVLPRSCSAGRMTDRRASPGVVTDRPAIRSLTSPVQQNRCRSIYNFLVRACYCGSLLTKPGFLGKAPYRWNNCFHNRMVDVNKLTALRLEEPGSACRSMPFL
ncbi:hypothetical protein BDV96DRAFT_386014 [Lophiotrema nucula]|uniref:Uncharacterized protein n=1 Tax=Lophiotrema nucula TaxID=690887 RepID=A0A6A5ZHZ5_9PLEO|nr:hypothetical protein BDV96DRAFT_386014 [Lophiotrema nucula]